MDGVAGAVAAQKLLARLPLPVVLVAGLTPHGAFALAAATAGTTTVERLAVYCIIFAAACLLLAFRILSLMVTAIIPFRYGEGVSVASPARARRQG